MDMLYALPNEKSVSVWLALAQKEEEKNQLSLSPSSYFAKPSKEPSLNYPWSL